MYGPDLSPVFRGCLIGLVLFGLVSIVAAYFGVRFFTDKPVIKSDTLIKPKMELRIDGGMLKIDTIYVYEQP